MNAPFLETERLILRCPAIEDFEAWATFCANQEAGQYIGGAMTVHAAWMNLAATIGAWHLRGSGVWSVIEKASGKWVGRVGAFMPYDWPGPEIGYSFTPAVWGKGYATEAARAAVDDAFARLEWPEVLHLIDERNTASQAVAKRLGARLIDVIELPGRAGRFQRWRQTRAEWASGPDQGGMRFACRSASFEPDLIYDKTM